MRDSGQGRWVWWHTHTALQRQAIWIWDPVSGCQQACRQVGVLARGTVHVGLMRVTCIAGMRARLRPDMGVRCSVAGKVTSRGASNPSCPTGGGCTGGTPPLNPSVQRPPPLTPGGTPVEMVVVAEWVQVVGVVMV